MHCNSRLKFLLSIVPFICIYLLVSCENKIDSKNAHTPLQDSISYHYGEVARSDIDNKTRKHHLDIVYDLFVENDVIEERTLYVGYFKAHELSIQKKHDSFVKLTNELISFARKLDNKYYQGLYHNLKGKFFKKNAYTASAYESFNKAKNLFIEINDSIHAGQSLLELAIIQKDQNDHHGSEETAVEGLSYLKNSEEKKEIASLYNIIGTNRRKLLNYEDAIEDYKNAIAISPNPKDKLTYKNNLAATYNDLKKHNKAIELLEETLKDSLIRKSQELKARVLDNLTYAKWLKDDKVDVAEDFLRVLHIRDSINDTKGLIASYTHLTEYFLNKNRQKAIFYGNKTIETSRKTKTPNAELDVLRMIHTIKPNDIPVRDRFIALSDSMKVEEKKAQNLFAKAKYDTKLAKKRNEDLQKENAEIDREKQKEEVQKTIYAIIAIAILIIAIIYFYFLYQKHKREKALQVYNTETRISKKVHDELANDVYNVMVILQKSLKNKTELPPKVLNQVEDIYVRTRNISHENHSIDTGEDFVDGLREMIGDFNTEEVAIIVKDIEYPNWETIENYVKIIIHRVLQELMVNMKKHSKANVVVLTFLTEDKKLIIHYSDNGIGLPFIKASKKGLLNMENRIQSAQGSLNFDSETGKGLKLSMTFPI